MENTVENKKYSLNNISEYIIVGLIFLIPVFFVPSIFVSVFASKMILIITAIVLCVGMFLASTLSRGTIVFPKTKLLIPLLLLPLIAFISSVFSGSIMKSFIGDVFDVGTSSSLFILVLLSFVTIFIVKENIKIGIKSLFALVFSSVLVIVHLLLRMYGAEMLPASVASRVPNFLVGGPLDTSILLGASIIGIMSILHNEVLSKWMKYLLSAVLVASTIFIGAVGFLPAVITIGLFALIYFVYNFSWMVGSTNNSKDTILSSIPSLVVLVISTVFVISGSVLSSYTSNLFAINTIEIRPGISVSVYLINRSIMSNPLLGTGPNMFKELWDINKPLEINNTQFWASDFNFGSGFVPTMFATSGLLGGLALLIFFGLYLYYGFKSLFANVGDNETRYLSSTTFFISVFLWIMSFLYVPSIAILALMFIFTGITIGTFVLRGIAEQKDINLFSSPKANFVVVFVIVICLISSVALGYFVWERGVASFVAQRGVAKLSNGDTLGARADLLSALRMVQTDTYWRAYSSVSMSEINRILSSVSEPGKLTDADRSAIQGAISDAVAAARNAIAYNNKNYQNWFALGNIYEILAQNGIEGSLENATNAYTEAQNRSPQNPAILLAFARLKAIAGDNESAKNMIIQSITIKNDYTDAYFALAQIEVALNNIQGAISSIEATTFIDPNNPNLYFQLGILKYNARDYEGSALAFERALVILPNYANAQYFLGLSYERLGRRSDALAQFNSINETNPGNQEVEFIISNLKAGKSPFSDAKPPLDNAPEKRKELPLNGGTN